MEDIINQFRFGARKLVRELGILDLEQSYLGRSPKFWHALIEIANHPRITLRALSELLVLTPSTMTRITNTLLEEGMIEAHAGHDKREKTLTLTPTGKMNIEKVDEFSNKKILGALEYLSQKERHNIANALMMYANALERSRLKEASFAIHTLSTSRVLRKQIIAFVADIQKNEFHIPITNEINAGILHAEAEYYYNNSYNFWYAIDEHGTIIGSIGLKQINQHDAEVKKCFVDKNYRGRGVSQKLFGALLKAADKHQFSHLYLGTVDILHAAIRFYEKLGFQKIEKDQLPSDFSRCELDTVFFEGNVSTLRANFDELT